MYRFVGYIKGFDKIAKIFKENNLSNSILYIVGSVRLDNDQKEKKYFDDIKINYSSESNIKIIDKYLSYEEFDIWINACDFVVFPYRKISNSGVLGRAKLFNKKVIVSTAGGLKNQIDNNDYIFDKDQDLKNIIINLDL